MPQWRRLSRLIATPVLLASWMVLPSAAGAAIPLAAPVPEPVAALESTLPVVVDPAPEAHEAVTPVAQAAPAPVEPAVAAAVPQRSLGEDAQKSLDEGAPAGSSHIAATSSGRRMSSVRAARGHGSRGATPRRAGERGVPAHRAPAASTGRRAAPQPAPVASEHAGSDPAPAGSAPGPAASGGSGGVFFGGGFALLVVSLLLAGPRLRRQLSDLPVVCRPAAFHVVLERPG